CCANNASACMTHASRPSAHAPRTSSWSATRPTARLTHPDATHSTRRSEPESKETADGHHQEEACCQEGCREECRGREACCEESGRKEVHHEERTEERTEEECCRDAAGREAGVTGSVEAGPARVAQAGSTCRVEVRHRQRLGTARDAHPGRGGGLHGAPGR